jgi:flagellar biosynthesis protein FlhG
VGKTSISVNLSLQLASQGYKVCLFDADLGLANINILLGLRPQHTLEDMILRGVALEDIILKDCNGIDIIPGSSGVEKMADLEDENLLGLVQAFTALDRYDFLLIDNSAGVSRQVIAFCLAASEVVLVITPEPTSLTDAYALLKILIRNGFEGKARVVVNQCRSHEIAKGAYSKFKFAVKNHLQTEVVPLGFLYEDSKVPEAVSVQQPFILRSPKTRASLCIQHISRNILDNKPAGLEALGVGSFWSRCLQLMRSPLSIEGIKKKLEEAVPAAGKEAKVPPMIAGGTARIEQKQPAAGPVREALIPSAEETTVPEPGISETIREDDSPKTFAQEDPRAAGQEVLPQPQLQEVIQALSSISQELSLIRQNMEKGGQTWQGGPDISAGSGEQGHSEAIVLDYETWVSRFRSKNN